MFVKDPFWYLQSLKGGILWSADFTEDVSDEEVEECWADFLLEVQMSFLGGFNTYPKWCGSSWWIFFFFKRFLYT